MLPRSYLLPLVLLPFLLFSLVHASSFQLETEVSREIV